MKTNIKSKKNEQFFSNTITNKNLLIKPDSGGIPANDNNPKIKLIVKKVFELSPCNSFKVRKYC